MATALTNSSSPALIACYTPTNSLPPSSPLLPPPQILPPRLPRLPPARAPPHVPNLRPLPPRLLAALRLPARARLSNLAPRRSPTSVHHHLSRKRRFARGDHNQASTPSE